MLALQLNVAKDLRLQARLPPKPGSGSEVDADLHISGRHIPFQQPAHLLERSSGTVRGEWTFTSLNWIPALFVRKPWLQLDGGGTLKADLRLRNGELSEGSTVDIPSAEAVAEVAGVRLAGTASAHGELKAGSPNQALLAVRLPRFTARPTDTKAVRLFDGRDLALDLTGDGRLQELRKGVRARLSLATPPFRTCPPTTAIWVQNRCACCAAPAHSAVMPRSIPMAALAMARPACTGATPAPESQDWTWAAMWMWTQRCAGATSTSVTSICPAPRSSCATCR